MSAHSHITIGNQVNDILRRLKNAEQQRDNLLDAAYRAHGAAFHDDANLACEILDAIIAEIEAAK